MLKIQLYIAIALGVSLSGYSQVQFRDSTLVWKHFEYALDDEYHITSWDANKIVEQEYSGLVIENEYIKLTLVPEFGGRIISFVYKPTGHEQLYQNPIGAPYGINEGNFYYNWLMVWGGIFPTFPEPEHGKSWLLPWTYEVMHNDDDSVVIQMAVKDTVSYQNKPGRFNNGLTGITCVATVKVVKGRSSFDLGIKLINDESTSKKMEYWTCNTFAPGSEIGNTFSPLSSEMVVPIDTYQPRWSPGNWLISSPIDEKAGTANDILKYEELRILGNWKDMGIAYAYPEMSSDFYGVINHENEEGIFRVGDNSITSGLKFWTWGKGAINNNPNNFNDVKRSYIELWSGLSYEFFSDAQIPANTTIAWTETFFPTFDLKGVTIANRDAHAFLDVDDSGLLTLSINTVQPGEEFNYELTIESEVVLEGSGISSTALNVESSKDLSDLNTDIASYQLVVSNSDGELINHSGELSLPYTPLATPRLDDIQFAINRVGSLEYELVTRDEAIAIVYDLQGRVHAGPIDAVGSTRFSVQNEGLYLVRVATGTGILVVKFVAR